jgi:regulatory protein
MKITAIKVQVKNENRVSVFLDEKYSFSLTLDQLLEEKLKKSDDIDDNRLKILKKLSDEGKLKQRTLEWVLGRPHSAKEFRDYLYKKQADKELIEAWVLEFKDKKYLDDEKFAIWFAENRIRKNKSTRAITAELYSKGIGSKDISIALKYLENYQQNDQQEDQDKVAIKNLVSKLKNRPRYQDVQKLKSYLVSKGFNYQDIKEVLEDEN